MDDPSIIEARRDANIANLCRAFKAPFAADLPSPFSALLRRMAAREALLPSPGPSAGPNAGPGALWPSVRTET